MGFSSTSTPLLTSQVSAGTLADVKRDEGKTRSPSESSTPCSTLPFSSSCAIMRSRCGAGASTVDGLGMSSRSSSSLPSIERLCSNREVTASTSDAAHREL